jgi:hypothetical protein
MAVRNCESGTQNDSACFLGELIVHFFRGAILSLSASVAMDYFDWRVLKKLEYRETREVDA